MGIISVRASRRSARNFDARVVVLAAMAGAGIFVGIEALAINSRFPPTITMDLRSGVRPHLSRRPRSHLASHTATWERHLDLARSAHQKRDFPEVRELCSRVIRISEDWSAVEQAHLRLALVEQKAKRVEAARRAFQQGTAACPSSDTLFMAWALMESKMNDPRSKKVATALLRRAVALNPRRHAGVLKWGIFASWKEAGEAAMEVVCSALSHGQMATTAPFESGALPTSGVVDTTGAPPSADVMSALREEALLINDKHPDSHPGTWFTTAGSIASAGTLAVSSVFYPSPSPREALEFVSRWGKTKSEEKELSLAAGVLDLCGEGVETRVPVSAASASVKSRRRNVAPGWDRFEEVLWQLERLGKGVVGGTESGGRELGGTWRLAFTTCTACNRALSRTGSDVYERLTPPIAEILPLPREPPVPFTCEVLVSPRGALPRSQPGDPKLRASTAFFRGWANVRRHDSGKVVLRQQVAPRLPKAGRGVDPASRPRVPASSSPAILSALGQVPRDQRGGLEKLVTQEVTYVGRRLRIGRTKDGHVYVYERCAWPEDQWCGKYGLRVVVAKREA